MVRKRIGNRGFTLIEAMIALVLSGLVGASIVGMLITTKEYGRAAVSQMTAKREGYAVIETLARRLREANLVVISEDNTQIDILNVDGTISRILFDEGPDGDPTGILDNALVFIADIEDGNQRIIAHRPTLVDGVPLFSRNQNHIQIRLRLGDAFDNPIVDRITGLGHQGYEIQTIVFLRNA